jgi:hypothetical protein
MQGLLVRVGIDSSCGHWRGPVKSVSGEFIYVPIPEGKETYPELRRTYDEFVRPLEGFGSKLPDHLHGDACHLDPDFETLTFGDQGQRASRIKTLREDDFIAFFASLKVIDDSRLHLLYALIGFFVVDAVISARDVPRAAWDQNAHTRRADPKQDIIVRAKRAGSGRLRCCLPMAEYRNRAYRVKQQLLDEWGGLDIKDGYIQRSAHLPRFNDARRFYSWFTAQAPELIARNN